MTGNHGFHSPRRRGLQLGPDALRPVATSRRRIARPMSWRRAPRAAAPRQIRRRAAFEAAQARAPALASAGATGPRRSRVTAKPRSSRARSRRSVPPPRAAARRGLRRGRRGESVRKEPWGKFRRMQLVGRCRDRSAFPSGKIWVQDRRQARPRATASARLRAHVQHLGASQRQRRARRGEEPFHGARKTGRDLHARRRRQPLQRRIVPRRHLAQIRHRFERHARLAQAAAAPLPSPRAAPPAHTGSGNRECWAMDVLIGERAWASASARELRDASAAVCRGGNDSRCSSSRASARGSSVESRRPPRAPRRRSVFRRRFRAQIDDELPARDRLLEPQGKLRHEIAAHEIDHGDVAEAAVGAEASSSNARSPRSAEARPGCRAARRLQHGVGVERPAPPSSCTVALSQPSSASPSA